MNSGSRNDGGVPVRVGAIPGRAPREETYDDANGARDETLRLRSVRRSAGSEGFEVRHSDYGYALIGTDRKAVDGRNDLNLKEVESLLKAARKR